MRIHNNKLHSFCRQLVTCERNESSRVSARDAMGYIGKEREERVKRESGRRERAECGSEYLHLPDESLLERITRDKGKMRELA